MKATDEFGQIRSGMWTGRTAKAAKGDPVALWLMAYLPTCPGNHMSGLFTFEHEIAAVRAGLDAGAVLASLRRLEADGFCVYDEGTSEIWVVSKCAVQLPGLKPADSKAVNVARQHDRIKSPRLRDGFAAMYAALLNAPPTPPRRPHDAPPTGPARPVDTPSTPRRVDNRPVDSRPVDSRRTDDAGATPAGPSVRPSTPSASRQPDPDPADSPPIADCRPVEECPRTEAGWKAGTTEDRARWSQLPVTRPEPVVVEARTAIESAFVGYVDAVEKSGLTPHADAVDHLPRAVLWWVDEKGLSPSQAAERMGEILAWAVANPGKTYRNLPVWAAWPRLFFGGDLRDAARRQGEAWNAAKSWRETTTPRKFEPSAVRQVAPADVLATAAMWAALDDLGESARIDRDGVWATAPHDDDGWHLDGSCFVAVDRARDALQGVRPVEPRRGATGRPKTDETGRGATRGATRASLDPSTGLGLAQ